MKQLFSNIGQQVVQDGHPWDNKKTRMVTPMISQVYSLGRGYRLFYKKGRQKQRLQVYWVEERHQNLGEPRWLVCDKLINGRMLHTESSEDLSPSDSLTSLIDRTYMKRNYPGMGEGSPEITRLKDFWNS